MSTATPNVLLQNLRDFTVQIRHAATDAIVGTGIAVSTRGEVLTCAHVVRAAGVEPRDGASVAVGVYYPRARGDAKKDRVATVASCFPQHDDDLVLLQLAGGPAPLDADQVAVLGRAEYSEGHTFRSYGYRRLDDYLAGRAEGKILGCVDCPEGRRVQADPVQLESSQINAGMSGAAVLDIERNLVVGIVSETWFPDETGKDRDTAWAVNACVCTFDPFNIPIQDAPLPLRAAPRPQTDVAAALAAAATNLGVVLHGAPPLPPRPSDQDGLLRSLNADWVDADRRVTNLQGRGDDRSRLARYWVESLLTDPAQPRPDGVFWWSFAASASVERFLEAALLWLSGGNADLLRRFPSARSRAHFVAAMLSGGRYLFVLDGLEAIQREGGSDHGLFTSLELHEFLEFFAAPDHQSFCLTLSRLPLFALLPFVTYGERELERRAPSAPPPDGHDQPTPPEDHRGWLTRRRLALLAGTAAVVSLLALLLPPYGVLWGEVGPRPPQPTAVRTATASRPPSPTPFPAAAAPPTPASRPTLSLSPEAIQFGDQAVGTVSDADLVIANGGVVPLKVEVIAITGNDAADFGVVADACSGSTVAPGGTCTTTARFTPSAAVPRAAELRVSSDAGGSPHAIALSGTGVALPPPLQISPSALAFGNQPVGRASGGRRLTLSNTGSSAVSFQVGVRGSGFAQSSDCRGTLAAGASCAISVTFTPAAAGPQSATLVISNGAGEELRRAPLSGVGTAQPTPPPTAAPTSAPALTPAPRPTATSASTPTRAPSPAPSPTVTPTPTPTLVPAPVPTPSPPRTPTPTPTPPPTLPPTPTPRPPTPTPTPTPTPRPPTPTPTPTIKPTPTPTPAPPPAALHAISVSSQVIAVGGLSRGTVTLTGPAPAGGALITLSSDNRSVAGVPSTVVVPAGRDTATFDVSSPPPAFTGLSAATVRRDAVITASYRGISRTATVRWPQVGMAPGTPPE